jgi:hypothetical protein
VPDLSRWSVAAHLVVGLTNPPLALIFYELFRIVGRRLAVLNVFFTLVATAIEIAFVAVQAAIQTQFAAGYDVSSAPNSRISSIRSLLGRLAARAANAGLRRRRRDPGGRLAGWAVLVDRSQGQQRRSLGGGDAGQARDVQVLVAGLGP